MPRRGDADAVERAARRAGLRHGPLTLATAERRRRRLWLLALAVIVITCVSGVVVTEVEADDKSTVAAWPLWVAVGASILFAFADVIVTERRLDRLTRLLVDEGIALGVEASRAGELKALADAGQSVNGDLDLTAVLDIILKHARELVGGDSGSIMLLEGDRLRVVCAHAEPDALGTTVGLGEGVAGRVATDRTPLLISGLPDRSRFDLLADRRVPLESAMSLPLVHRDELIGVLNVNAPSNLRFTDHDLLLVSVLADHAAVAIATSRALQEEQRLAADLAAAHRLVEQTASALDDVLLPDARAVPGLAAPGDAGAALRRLERDLRGLALVLATHAPPVRPEPVDLAAAARLAAERSEAAREPIALHGADEPLLAFADPAAVTEIIEQLLANAAQHGRPPIELELDAVGGSAATIRLTVLDRGSGMGLDPGRMFEPFVAGANGGVGLGLTVVRRLAEAQGGSASGRSRTGGGCAVSVVLPAAVTPAPDYDAPPSETGRSV